MESENTNDQKLINDFVATEQTQNSDVNDELGSWISEEKYGTLPQQALTAVEGAASAATFGLSTGIQEALGVDMGGVQARREENPISYGAGQVAGLVGTSGAGSLPKGAGYAIERVGQAAAAKVLPAIETAALSKIGSQATKLAVENMLVTSGDEISKMFSDDAPPSEAAQTALVNVGLSGLIGGALGGSFGAVSPLWEATAGPRLQKIVGALKDKVDGVLSPIPDDLIKAADEAGIALSPETMAAMSDNPVAKQAWNVLQNTNTKSGLAAQEALSTLKKETADKAVEALGKSPEAIDKIKNISEFETGKKIVGDLRDSIKNTAEPIIEEFNKIRQQFSKVPLTAESDILADRLANLAESKYGSYRLGDDYLFIQKQLSNLPNIRDLEGLRQVQSSLWNEAKSGKASWDAVGSVVGLFREVEGEALLRAAREEGEAAALKLAKGNKDLVKAAGKEGKELLKAEQLGIKDQAIQSGEDMVMKVQLARSSYGDLARELEELNKFTKLKGWRGPESFIEALGEAGEESMLRKLGREDSVRLSEYLKTKFPGASKVIKDYQVDSILQSAAKAAKEGEIISPTKLFKEIDDLSPEMRASLFPPETLKRLSSIKELSDFARAKPANPSGTAKTLDAIWDKIPATALGAATLIAGHNPVAALLVGGLTNIIAKDVPDATRLALLKYIGKGGKIEAGAFKTMVDYISTAAKGEMRLNLATKNVFKTNAEVISANMVPSEKDRKKLEKRLVEAQENPVVMTDVGGSSGVYLPNQATGTSETAMNAVNYLNQIRPGIKKSAPLDKGFPPSKFQQARFNRALDIAEQPMLVLRDIKDGTITQEDVTDLKSMYPSLFSRLQNKMLSQMNDHLAEDGAIPYKTRMGLSLFLQQPLDSTLSGQSILALQAQNSVINAQNIAQNQPKGNLSALKKSSNQFLTPEQSRIMRKNEI